MDAPEPTPHRAKSTEAARVLYRNLKVLTVIAVVFLFALAVAPAKAYFSDWRAVQTDYNQRAEQAGLPPVPVEIRQIWRPDTKVTDRCVSCHLAMGGEKPLPDGGALFGKHPDVHHDVSQMGCTGCHRGQGRATSKDSAHGHVKHWEEPMLPRPHLGAACGSCHGPGAQVPRLSRLEQGAYLFELHGCGACHAVNGAGGQVGPDLSSVGLKGYSRDWQTRHLESPTEAVEGSRMMSFGHLTETEADVLAAYMDALIGTPTLARGKALTHTHGCRGCHAINGVGGDDGPDLSAIGDKLAVDLDFSHADGEQTQANWHRQHLRQPAFVAPGSTMPRYDLPERDEDALVTYLLSLRETPPLDELPKPTILAHMAARRDYEKDGASLYRVFCNACHGADGLGQNMPSMKMTVPGMLNLDLLAIASEGYFKRTMDHGRPGRHMPAWSTKKAGLSPDEIDKLVAYTLSHRPTAPSFEHVQERLAAMDADGIERGQHRFIGDCSGCHGNDGAGTVLAPGLINPSFLYVASNEFLYQTIVDGRDDTAMPAHREYDADDLAEVLAWLRSHEPGAADEPAPEEDATPDAREGADSDDGGDWTARYEETWRPILRVDSLRSYRANGSAVYGKRVYEQLCLGCHGPRAQGGIGPAIGEPGFLRTVDDGFIAASILLGRDDRAMRAFGPKGITPLSGDEIGDIISYLRASATQRGHDTQLARVHADKGAGGRLFKDLCSGCHGEDGVGRSGPALNNAGFLASATDGFLQATIIKGRRGTAMRGWARSGTGFGALSPQEVNEVVAFMRSWQTAPKSE